MLYNFDLMVIILIGDKTLKILMPFFKKNNPFKVHTE